ncbi:MAG TPA: diguanylate cyclase [Candidatus Baltobacteraceae bacterium]|nr:diguanylate cyclase [Candidatus Baltobacteraceae bacterium]
MNMPDVHAVLAALYAETPDGVVLYDLRGNVLAANDAALAMSGYRFEELAGKSYRDMMAIGDERVEIAVRTALAGGRDHFECAARRKDGSAVAVECYVFPARDQDGRMTGIFVQAHDIGDLKTAEESLAVNQQRFRSLFEYHPDGIMELKSDGRISRVNVAFESETGFYTEQIVGKPWTDLLAPEKREKAAEGLHDAMRGEAAEHDSLLLDRLGNRIDVQLKLVPIHARDAIAGAYAVFKNVTAQKSAERTIALQAERVARLYMVAAARGESIDDQIDATLRLGLELFHFDAAYITIFDGERVSIRNSVGENSPIPKGAVYPKSAVFSRHLSDDREMLVISDILASEFCEDPARVTIDWRSYVAFRLTAGPRVFGALVFAAHKPHTEIAAGDRDLIALMGLFVSAALERAEHSEHIEQLAFNDSLTGLPNRVLFADRIANTMATAKRYDRGFAVMYLDLDHFKTINDTYGHMVGDQVLKAVAERLRSTLRDSDTVARFGGDEFVILEPVVDGPADSADLARKLHNALQEPVTVGGVSHNVQISIGIALFPNDATTIEGLMEAADGALYRAKREGRNRWFFANADVARAGFKQKKA